MSRFLLKVEREEGNEFITVSFFGRISREIMMVIIKTVASAGIVIAVVQQYSH